MKSFFELSVLCQNAHAELEFFDKDVRLDPNTIKILRKKISNKLKQLVSEGDLVPVNLNFNNGKGLNDEERNKLVNTVMHFVDLLAAEYGYYTASEMLNVGISRKLWELDDRHPRLTEIKLPKKHSDDFFKKVAPFLK